MVPLVLQAPAKINLHLEVGPVRSDGVHSLRTLFQEISLHDTLRFVPTLGPLTLTITPKGLPTGQENLVLKALHLLRSKLKIKEGMQVHLTKRIPVGAGLGGGSSDAALALWGGWMVWRARQKNQKKPSLWPHVPPVLFKCARQLGADVPFFLKGGRVWAEGVGDKLVPLKKQERRWLVLVYPRIQVSTKEAYGLLDRSRANGVAPHFETNLPFPFFNSFEPVILTRFPIIAQVKKVLLSVGCYPVMMSGSGSSVFGFVKNRSMGLKVRKSLPKKPWDTYLVHT